MLIVKTILIALGLLGTVTVLCAGGTWLEKKSTIRDYDERQMKIRGKAYRLVCLTGAVYFTPVVIWQMLLADSGLTSSHTYLVLFLGVWGLVLLFYTYCLWNGAALPLTDKHPWAIGVCLLFGGYEIVKFIGYGSELRVAQMGMVPLLMGAGFLYLAVLHLIQHLKERGEEAR